jgi:uncharacterized protein YcnI
MMSTQRRRLATLAVCVPMAVLVSAVPASAHVTVHSYEAVRGGSDAVLSFRTPNEMDNATTVKLQVFLPTDTPLLGVLVQPLTGGWRFAVKSITLKTPVQTDDGPITQAVSEITWRGGHIPVGGYQDFNIDVSDLPDVASLTFKAIQTYSNGKVVRWIETAAPGSPEPDFPAPVLHLAAPAGGAVVTAQSTSHDGRNLAIAALAVAVVALWVSVAGRIRRRG